MNLGRFCTLLASLAALTAFTALTAPGARATTTPAPGYEQFAGCPHPGEEPVVVTCFRSVTSGGLLQMGNVKIPIEEPITLSGGMTAGGEFRFRSPGGLSPAKQSVPGGVVGFTGFTFLEEILTPQELLLYAVIELAGTPGDQLAEPASLPVKVHFINAVLGNKCYVGSNANPIKLELITGETSPPPPNEPITGVAGTHSTTLSGVTHIAEGTYVDNSFATPGASGCVFTLFGFIPISINAPINATSKLPSPAGSNTTIQEFDSESVSAAIVYP